MDVTNDNGKRNETALLTGKSAERFNNMGRYDYSLFNSIKSGRVEQLEHSGSYRLFFLLEGKVYLKAGAEGKYLIDGKEFILYYTGFVNLTARNVQ